MQQQVRYFSWSSVECDITQWVTPAPCPSFILTVFYKWIKDNRMRVSPKFFDDSVLCITIIYKRPILVTMIYLCHFKLQHALMHLFTIKRLEAFHSPGFDASISRLVMVLVQMSGNSKISFDGKKKEEKIQEKEKQHGLLPLIPTAPPPMDNSLDLTATVFNREKKSL